MQNRKNHYNPVMSRFSDYLQKTFDFSPEQSEEVIAAMRQPL